MSALANLRPATPEPARPADIHDAYAFLIDLERRTEINIAICQSRDVCARHRRDMRLVQIIIDVVGKAIDQRGECRAESQKREFRARAKAELLERLK